MRKVANEPKRCLRYVPRSAQLGHGIPATGAELRETLWLVEDMTEGQIPHLTYSLCIRAWKACH
ncbi:hypothetical protein J6590_081390 [Homalodisca vitripennis]|nr:hypothetical protein J6590_081390 [Homalodisca vitripennis]